jgi:formate hydrogenlyase transcriptional activator
MSGTPQRAAEITVTRRYEALLRVSQTLISTRSSEELFRLLARELRAVVNFYVMGVGIYDENAHEVRLTSYGEPGDPLEVPNFAPEETFSWWVYQHQQPLVIPSLDAETRFPAVAEMLKNRGVRSVCTLPLTTVHRRLGGLAVGSIETDAYSPEEVSFLSLVANQVALAVDDALNFDALLHAREALCASEQSFRLIIDSIPGLIHTLTPAGEVEFVNQKTLDYFGKTLEEIKSWASNDVFHPDDLPRAFNAWKHTVENGQPEDIECRCRRADGVYRWFQLRCLPQRNAEDRIIRWISLHTDIDDRKRIEEALRASEEGSRLTIASVPGLVNTMSPSGEVEFANQRWLDYHGKTLEEMKGWQTSDVIHPDDLPHAATAWKRSIETEQPFEDEYRIRRADGVYRWFHGRSLPLRDTEGRIVRWYSLITDIEERKQAEVALRRSESYLAEAQRLTRSGSWAWNVRTGAIFWSQEIFRIYDYDPEKIKPSWSHILERVHPEDRPGIEQRAKIESTQKEKVDSEGEFRIVLPDGSIKHLHSVSHPLMDESGEITEIVGTVMDVTEQHAAKTALETAFEQIKKLKDQLFNENIVLREEVAQASMFEEIIGSSKALRSILEQLSIVASADSTVLIQGETGTGKELIARAIHNLSPRKDQAFVKVNCAAIPSGLLESELFGHEKGSFTGAIAQKIGRFELAHKGTLFLDEVGDIPLELQPKLLRVLQEQEFERLGSTRTQRVDVRLLAATNANLTQLVAEKKFRSDLYYRLNVFPVTVPPLRERREDIPLLVRHFANKYARRMGKKIESIPKETMHALAHYAWPGNIRELQNLMERAVLLSTGPLLRVPLAEISACSDLQAVGEGNVLEQAEREQIVRALRESNWVVGGARGAAARLGLKRTSLAYKMQKLGISRPPQ